MSLERGRAEGVCSSRRTRLTSHSSEDVVCLQLYVMLSPMQKATPLHREESQEIQEDNGCPLGTGERTGMGRGKDIMQLCWVSHPCEMVSEWTSCGDIGQ